MKKINGIALTDKGVLKNAVRASIKEKDVNALVPTLEDLGYEYCEEKNAFVLPREDNNGNVVYTVLTMTISTKHPSNLADRKPKAKPSTEKDIEIE